MATILVVDDDADIRLLLRIELTAEHHQIVEAADGGQALVALDAESPDLVLLDMMMPVLDGWGVLAAVDGPSAPPIVVITALASDGDRHIAEILAKGAIEVIAKPFDPGQLISLVDATLLLGPGEREQYRRRRLARTQHG